MTARLLVAGSRLLTVDRHADAIEQGLVWCGKLLGRDTVLVHGSCPPAVRSDRHGQRLQAVGLDTLAAARWAAWGLPVDPHPAHWGRLGVRAGPIRNQQMVDSLGGGPALCMAWPHPDPREPSAGTWDCVRRALAAHVTVLSGWLLTPILEVPELPPHPGYTGPMPHREVIERAAGGAGSRPSHDGTG